MRFSKKEKKMEESSDEESDMEKFETVPIFHPTLEEMKDFDQYLVQLKEKGVDKIGLCKVIPPSEWTWNPSIEKARKMKVRNPIQQCVTGRSGVYSVCNLVKKNLVLEEFVARTDLFFFVSSFIEGDELFVSRGDFLNSRPNVVEGVVKSFELLEDTKPLL